MKMFVFTSDDLAKAGIVAADEEIKCGCCNWRVSHLYVLADSREEALQMIKDGVAGLCGDCMSELIVEMTTNNGYELVKSSETA